MLGLFHSDALVGAVGLKWVSSALHLYNSLDHSLLIHQVQFHHLKFYKI